MDGDCEESQFRRTLEGRAAPQRPVVPVHLAPWPWGGARGPEMSELGPS